MLLPFLYFLELPYDVRFRSKVPSQNVPAHSETFDPIYSLLFSFAYLLLFTSPIF